MTVQWGTPLSGTQEQIPEDHELKVGDRIITRGDFLFSPDLQTEQMVLDVLKLKYDHFEPNFALKYVKVRSYIKNVPYFPFKEWHCEVDVHVSVIKASPISPNAIALLIGGLLAVLFVTVISWTFYYVGETAGPVGIGLLLVVVILVVLAFIGVRFKR